MRVLHVLEAIEAGCARHVTDLVTHLTDVEHVVVTPAERIGGYTDRRAVPAMRAAGADVRLVDMRRSVTAPHNARAVLSVAGLVRSLRPDVVHGHASIGGVVARLAARARPGTACVWTPNGVLEHPAVVAVERRLARLTDRIIAVSPSERDRLRRLRIGRADDVVVIPNGIELVDPDEPAPDLRSVCGLPPAAPLVGCVARLSEQKGINVVLAAFRRVAQEVPDARFVLIGSGPLAGFVREQTAGWDRFVWLDGLQDARRVLGQLDVFVLLSRYEGAPYTPLEAMWAGAPVVLSDVTGNRDAVADGSGVLVPPEDAGAAADAVVRLLDDRPGRERLIEAGRRTVAQRFDVRGMAAATGAVYEQLARAPRRLG